MLIYIYETKKLFKITMNGGIIMSKQTYHTAVRISFFVDGTGSMDEFSKMIKNFLKNSNEKITNALNDAARQVEQLEVQLAVFRDFFEEKEEEAFYMSRVYNLLTEKDEFEKEVDKMTWFGGGDDPESSLQALYLGMKKTPKLVTDATKKRWVIFLFTDNPSHSFEEIINRGGIECYPNYPIDDLPKDLDTFYNEYHSKQGSIFEKSAGVGLKDVRLNIFAPEKAYPFDVNNIASWANVTRISIKENGELEDVSEETLLATIVASC